MVIKNGLDYSTLRWPVHVIYNFFCTFWRKYPDKNVVFDYFSKVKTRIIIILMQVCKDPMLPLSRPALWFATLPTMTQCNQRYYSDNTGLAVWQNLSCVINLHCLMLMSSYHLTRYINQRLCKPAFLDHIWCLTSIYNGTLLLRQPRSFNAGLFSVWTSAKTDIWHFLMGNYTVWNSLYFLKKNTIINNTKHLAWILKTC